jgi:hypothetical protein
MRLTHLGVWLVCANCAVLDETVRVERGPLLREFDRPQVIDGGIRGTLAFEDHNPFAARLKFEIMQFDTCRTLRVEEYAEDTIRERRGSGTGPALSAGITLLAASGSLFLASTFLSKEPDRSRIDGGGHYGASPAVVARGWGIAVGALSIPTLTVGLIQFFRTGESVETHKVEQIASQKDSTCHGRALDGPVSIVYDDGETAGPFNSAQGAVWIESQAPQRLIEGFRVYDRPVVLDEASVEVLNRYNQRNTVR